MILAIDQSLTETGLALVDREGALTTGSVCTYPTQPWKDRIGAILGAIDEFLSKGEVVCAVLENYAYGGSKKGFVLGELGGVIKWHLLSKGLPVYQVVAAHHKMFITRYGAATKDQVIANLKRRFNLIEPNNNIADAISMGFLARGYFDFKEGRLKPSNYDKMLFVKFEKSLIG